MQTLARFVIRPNEQGQGDLVLGAMFKAQNAELLSPNKVYEIREVVGTLMIVPVGDAHIANNKRPADDAHGICWGNDISYILDVGNGRHLLTVEETANMKERYRFLEDL